MKKLQKWFIQAQRNLPWRKDRTPYKVWIAETMLQQTQASVVVARFPHWVERFPTVTSLARAPLEALMKEWEGLGYYSRVRNLHRAAKIMLSQHEGKVPHTREELIALPGIGPYTAGAILNFAFHQRAVAIDSNITRVLSRLFASKERSYSFYEKLMSTLLPNRDPWVFTEGLMELGALLCQKQPKCEGCPLKERCQAYQENNVLSFPFKKKRPSMIYLHRVVAVITHKKELLVRQVKEGEVMAGLYEFPYVTLGDSFFISNLTEVKCLSLIRHSFTHYKATLYPKVYRSERRVHQEGWEWKKWVELNNLPFSAGHRRILEMLKLEYFTY